MSNDVESNPSPDTHPPGKLKYFLKELVSNPVYLVLTRNGKQVQVRVPFEDFGADQGGITMDSTKQVEEIMAIRRLISERRGGVSEVTAEEYEASKKVGGEQEQRLALLRPKSLLQLIREDLQEKKGVVDRGSPKPVLKDPSLPDNKIPSVQSQESNGRIPKPRKAKALAANQVSSQD